MPSRNIGPSVGRADQMEMAVEEIPEIVLLAVAEEADPLRLGTVGGVFPLQRVHVELEIERIDERPDEPPLVEEMHHLRRRIDEACCGACADRRARSPRRRGSSRSRPPGRPAR